MPRFQRRFAVGRGFETQNKAVESFLAERFPRQFKSEQIGMLHYKGGEVARILDKQGLVEGRASDLRALARHAGFTERYVGKVFPCAFLAPDIIESILQGHQPDDLTFARLSTEIPLSWGRATSVVWVPSGPIAITLGPASVL